MKYTSSVLVLAFFMVVQLNVVGQGLPFQALLRDNAGVAISNKDVTVRFEVTSGETIVYSEEHQAKTDASGLLSLQIGSETADTGNFDEIDWHNGSYFIRTKVDTGSGYNLIGSQELLSVPYTEYAKLAGGISKAGTNDKTWQLVVDDSGDVQVIPFPKGYSKLVFQDEFNGTGLPDPVKWGYEVGFVRGSEMQYYANARIENTFRQDGLLTLRAINNDTIKDASGKILNKKTLDGNDYYITSGSIRTKYKADWKHCRVEVRAKVPTGSGTWPAVWMMPASDQQAWQWPNGGEIDIMEQVGNDPYKFCHAIHRNKKPADGCNQVKYDALTEFHVFALEWTERSLAFYVDDVLSCRIAKKADDTWREWPFNENNFYLIINLAFGGVWGGQAGYDVTKMPLDYLIDYVRVFQ